MGQGPRPDLLSREWEHPVKTPSPYGKDEKAPVPWKDRAAMILALFELILPWIAAGGLALFLLLVLLTGI